MARPPKPTALHRAAETYREDRHGTRIDEQVAGGSPQKPDWLNADASWAWDEITSCLAAGVLASVDVLLLAGTCRWWAEWRRWDLAMGDGECDPYKAGCMAGMAWKAFTVGASKLGLSPVDRARLRAPERKQEQSGKLRFFAG
jgi:phage terminase small subunit